MVCARFAVVGPVIPVGWCAARARRGTSRLGFIVVDPGFVVDPVTKNNPPIVHDMKSHWDLYHRTRDQPVRAKAKTIKAACGHCLLQTARMSISEIICTGVRRPEHRRDACAIVRDGCHARCRRSSGRIRPLAVTADDAGHRAAGLIPAMAEEDAPRSASPRSVVA